MTQAQSIYALCKYGVVWKAVRHGRIPKTTFKLRISVIRSLKPLIFQAKFNLGESVSFLPAIYACGMVRFVITPMTQLGVPHVFASSDASCTASSIIRDYQQSEDTLSVAEVRSLAADVSNKHVAYMEAVSKFLGACHCLPFRAASAAGGSTSALSPEGTDIYYDMYHQ
ncbi:hypothetical protein V8E54_003387 [Elaphomyces granulatus]